jgi:hypothetical protein
MEWLTTDKDEVVKVAWPELLRVPVPRAVLLSMKVTLPFGVPVPGVTVLIVAVKVTDWPYMDGLADDVTEVDVDACFTVWVNADEVLGVKLESPLYTAVTEWLATDKTEVMNVAWSLLLRVPVPSMVVPSLKVTVPVGVPAPGDTALTLAVKVSDCPKTDELPDDFIVIALEAWLTV